jgi:ketosteroid isomerase-like protein
MPATDARDQIISCEKGLLDKWADGNVLGYTDAMAADGTYFDDIGASERLRGREAIRAYAEALSGQIPPHRYEMVDPVVQMIGDVGVLTFRYHPSSRDGTPLTPWRATTVYRREGAGWSQVHAHWSIQKTP